MKNKAVPYVALAEWLLIFPAMLFMVSLFARNVQPPGFEPADTARRVVEWFSRSPRIGLQLFLIALPLAAFVIGCATVLRRWRSDAVLRQSARAAFAVVRAHLATLLIAGATLAAGGILAVVALHMITE
jgi:hypothetical protein